jgi:phosphoserine aminotransferase
MLIDRPGEKPDRPYFSSGPCAKPPGWGPEHLALGSLGRSHRSKLGKARLGYAIELTRKILRVPPPTASASSPLRTRAPWRWRCGACSGPGP